MFAMGPAFFGGSGIVYPFLVYDTFTGGGLLSTHTGETGTPWTGGGATYALAGGFVCPTAGIGSSVFAVGSAAFDDGYAEIEVNLNSNLTPIRPTFFLMHADGIDGSTSIIDSGQHSVPITVFGGAVLSSAQSKFGSTSVSFNGIDAYLEAATFPNIHFGFVRAPLTGSNPNPDFFLANRFIPRPWCFECFVYFTDVGNARGIMSIYLSGGTNLFWHISRDTLNRITVSRNNGGSDTIYLTSPGSFASDTWHHIVFCCTNRNQILFVNGLDVARTVPQNGLGNFDMGVNLVKIQIGRGLTGSDHMLGYIDEVRMSNLNMRYWHPFVFEPVIAPFSS
jgi:Concanavalin A-like lectin/glucanases superfamily